MMIRRYLAEAFGAFFIVLVAMLTSNVVPGFVVAGFTILVLVLTVGPISAAHLNPAVTIGFAVAKRFPWKFVGPYIVSQVVGAIVGGALGKAIVQEQVGATLPALPTIGQSFALEMAMSALLMFVIVGVATDRRAPLTVAGLAIGLAIAVGASAGASMNPARSIGPALFDPSGLADLWMYLIAPNLGAAAGALAYESIRIAPEHAQGAPNELLSALQAVQAEEPSAPA